ncbi:hypothetical protein [Pseudomonas sp.]|uniref:hypothetical protein n=1 Tax=Pseudomonas sp. TaxID=306 RepID=UPI00258BBECB|nr:hypothetical protein [Pseudomonas sp.]
MEPRKHEEAQSPVVKRTPHHIYEHCDSVTVIGMKPVENGQTRIILQLGRDMSELADGTTKENPCVQVIRHTFATISMDSDAAIEMANAIMSNFQNENELA